MYSKISKLSKYAHTQPDSNILLSPTSKKGAFLFKVPTLQKGDLVGFFKVSLEEGGFSRIVFKRFTFSIVSLLEKRNFLLSHIFRTSF